MLMHLLVALGLTAVTVLIHAAGTLVIVWAFRGRSREVLAARKPIRVVLPLVGLVSFLLLLHLAEAGVWAIYYRLAGMLPDLETAAYFSFTSYTTVGYGDVLMPYAWRMLGPIEAGVGILMFGWSAAIIVRALEPTVARNPDYERGDG